MRLGGVAVAGRLVQVLATARAKPLAVRLAERTAGQGQKHLLAHDIVQLKAALFIIADFRLVGTNCVLPGVGVHGVGPEDQVESAFEGGRDRLHTAGAELGEVAMPVRPQADVGYVLLVATVLDNQVGAAGGGQRPGLGDVRGVVQHAGRDGFVEDERFSFEIERGNQHKLSVGGYEQEINGRNSGESLVSRRAGQPTIGYIARGSLIWARRLHVIND